MTERGARLHERESPGLHVGKSWPATEKCGEPGEKRAAVRENAGTGYTISNEGGVNAAAAERKGPATKPHT